MECMAIGGPNGNNPLANLFIKNNSTTGVAQNNQTDQVSSTEETSVDKSKSAANSSERIAQLQKALGADGFSGTVDFNTLAKTAGASPIASSAIKFNENITATSALGEPSSVTAIKDPVFSEIAAGGNPQIAFGNQQLLLAAKMSQANGLSGDFQVANANATTEKDNGLLALVGNA